MGYMGAGRIGRARSGTESWSAAGASGKVDGSLEWAVDVKLPGMVHARNVRPPGARLQLHGVSRTLYEEVRFDGEKVTSVDWHTHPTLTHMDTPERIDVVIVNGDPNPDRPDLLPYGAGEPSHRTVPAAIANGIHDATGARMRRLPLRPERVLAELERIGLQMDI